MRGPKSVRIGQFCVSPERRAAYYPARQEIRELSKNMDSKIDSLRNDLESKFGELREELRKSNERVARIEGFLKGVFMRRDLTPFPEPPPSGGRPDKPRAA